MVSRLFRTRESRDGSRYQHIRRAHWHLYWSKGSRFDPALAVPKHRRLTRPWWAPTDWRATNSGDSS